MPSSSILFPRTSRGLLSRERDPGNSLNRLLSPGAHDYCHGGLGPHDSMGKIVPWDTSSLWEANLSRLGNMRRLNCVRNSASTFDPSLNDGLSIPQPSCIKLGPVGRRGDCPVTHALQAFNQPLVLELRVSFPRFLLRSAPLASFLAV